MSARRLSMVTNSTLRGLAATVALGAALGAAWAEASADGAGAGLVAGAGGSVLEQAARSSAGTNERSRMGLALLLGLDLPLQTIELTFQILLGNAVRRVLFQVLGRRNSDGIGRGPRRRQ